jgi:hypothetical protein
MLRAAALSCSLVMASAVPAAVAGQSTSTFEALTVPPATLPVGCVLAPAETEHHDGGRYTFGFWFGLPVRSNPWTGDTPRILSDIRTRMFGPPRIPDALPDARITQGRVAMLIVGDRGPCFTAIEQHVRSARVGPD